MTAGEIRILPENNSEPFPSCASHIQSLPEGSGRYRPCNAYSDFPKQASPFQDEYFQADK